MAAYAVTTGGVTMISGASAANDAQTLPGTVAMACHVCRISRVLAPAGTDGGGVVSLEDGGAANPSSSDELETTICHLRG